MGQFSDLVTQFTRETEQRMTAVFRDSIQTFVEIMQEPGPSLATTKIAISRGKFSRSKRASKRQYGPISNPGGNGNLPVDTGFLRASLVATPGKAPPSLVTDNPTGRRKTYNPERINAVIASATLEQGINFVYTASYAYYVEMGARGRAGRRFVGLAVQRWPQIVSRSARQLEYRVRNG
jgi:hypothetical protein